MNDIVDRQAGRLKCHRLSTNPGWGLIDDARAVSSVRAISPRSSRQLGTSRTWSSGGARCESRSVRRTSRHSRWPRGGGRARTCSLMHRASPARDRTSGPTLIDRAVEARADESGCYPDVTVTTVAHDGPMTEVVSSRRDLLNKRASMTNVLAPLRPAMPTHQTVRETAPAARVVDAVKVHGHTDNVVHALDQVTVDFGAERFTAVMGPSGSRKSTLMHCVVGLDSLTSGTILIGNTVVAGSARSAVSASAPSSAGPPSTPSPTRASTRSRCRSPGS